MPTDLSNRAWEQQNKILRQLRAVVPRPFDLYKGGTGNKLFVDRIDQAMGFWRPDNGALRWLFHVVPKGSGFNVRLPLGGTALDLPGGLNTESPKIVLSYMVVTLFKKDGVWQWPAGWQWTLLIVLRDPVPRLNTSVKIHRPYLTAGKLSADRENLSVVDWALVGNIAPDETAFGDGFSAPVKYSEVGAALLKLIVSLKP